jgi:hypothetical protein
MCNQGRFDVFIPSQKNGPQAQQRLARRPRLNSSLAIASWAPGDFSPAPAPSIPRVVASNVMALVLHASRLLGADGGEKLERASDTVARRRLRTLPPRRVVLGPPLAGSPAAAPFSHQSLSLMEMTQSLGRVPYWSLSTCTPRRRRHGPQLRPSCTRICLLL